MKFSTCITKIASSRSEAEVRSSFMENAGQLVGAKAWGLDLLDNQLQVVESDLHGLPNSFRDRYREIGRDADGISQRMIQERIPVHNLSMQTPLMWRQSKLYQQLFQGYGIAHGMVAPLVGNSGLIGGIYFMRGDDFAPFCDADLIRIGTLCQHLSVRLATLRLPWIASISANVDCLTDREMEIIELVAQGLSNREIAIKINISRDGVKQALKRIFRKLNVSARTEMIAKLKN